MDGYVKQADFFIVFRLILGLENTIESRRAIQFVAFVLLFVLTFSIFASFLYSGKGPLSTMHCKKAVEILRP